MRVDTFEFIINAIVKVVRWNSSGDGENLVGTPSLLLMLRVHDITEYVKLSTSHEQIMRLGHKISHHLTSPPNYTVIPFNYSWCTDPNRFRSMFNIEVSRTNLFLPYNTERISDLITGDFHSCFSFRDDNVIDHPSNPTTRIVFVIEVLRKFVYVGGEPSGILPTGEEDEEETGKSGDGQAAVKLQYEEELGESSLQDAEKDYSETEFRAILGSLKYHYQKMMQVSTKELSEVNAAIRILNFKGRSCEEYQCHICLERFRQREEIARMPCSHLFHKDCAFKWLFHRSDSCPLCRSVCKTLII